MASIQYKIANLKAKVIFKLVDNMNSDSDAEVIKRILNGEVFLFEIFIRRYNPCFYRIARSYGFNHHDAEDLIQETHITAYTHLSQFEQKASYKTWVSRILINKCRYKLRYGYFKNEFPSEILSNSTNQAIMEKTKDNQTEKILLNRELSLVLEKSIQQIPVIYRTVFLLREIEGFSVLETAELLNITPTNVKVRLNRSKALLQKEIEQFYNRAELYSFNLVYCNSIVQKVFDKIKGLKTNCP